MSDSIEILEAALAGSEKAVRDRDQEIALLKTTIKGFEAALEIANEKAHNAIAPDIQRFADVVDSVVNDKLIEKIEQRDRTRSLHESQTKCRDYASAKLEELLDSRQKKIETLEDNLNRARSEHLEQLRAIAQMLEPLATHEDKGSLYLSHFGKAAMVYMIQKVIYANIEKLDPKPSTYSNDF